ncbi:hypothetical protein BDF22DRAFT_745829 [Syncephalis plumigaleata]|nr:hypothetical protein BDF22DRAFT_745829 [Syncephalis plumigaleata]
MDRPSSCYQQRLERPRFDCLPLELRIYHIYAILPVHTLARCRAVSRHWQSVVDETLEKAHPYQRIFALRELSAITTTHHTKSDWHSSLNIKYSSNTNGASAASPGFPLLSLNTWEEAFYTLGVPRQFAKWFRNVRLGLSNDPRSTTATSGSRSTSTASTPTSAANRQRRPDPSTDTGLPWRARVLLEETEALCFLYQVCYGIACRPRYIDIQDVQSGVCINYLHLALDMFDRLHEAVETMKTQLASANSAQEDTSNEESSLMTDNGQNTSLQHESFSRTKAKDKQQASTGNVSSMQINLTAPASEWIDVLQQQQQRIFTQILQLPAMSSRFLLGHSAFCFNFISRLFSAFSMLPISAAQALARLVHGIITLPDGTVTVRELDTLLTCLAGKEPLALSLLARHQLLLRYESLIGPDEANACRVDLDELRRLVSNTTYDAMESVDTAASTTEGISTSSTSTNNTNRIYNVMPIRRMSVTPTEHASPLSTASSPLGISVPSASYENKDTDKIPSNKDEDAMPPSPTESFTALTSFSLPGSPMLNGSMLNISTEQRLIWLFEHVTALAVPQQAETAVFPQHLHADAIMPFVNEFEMLLNRCTSNTF